MKIFSLIIILSLLVITCSPELEIQRKSRYEEISMQFLQDQKLELDSELHGPLESLIASIEPRSFMKLTFSKTRKVWVARLKSLWNNNEVSYLVFYPNEMEIACAWIYTFQGKGPSFKTDYIAELRTMEDFKRLNYTGKISQHSLTLQLIYTVEMVDGKTISHMMVRRTPTAESSGSNSSTLCFDYSHWEVTYDSSGTNPVDKKRTTAGAECHAKNYYWWLHY
jgi:hypothetical protein